MSTGQAFLDADDRARARAEYVLRAHALERLSVALGGRGLDVLVIKGAALAMTHYPEPWTRAMSDIDFVVRPGAEGRILDALVAHGLVVVSSPGRPLSERFFGETVLTLGCGGASMMLELHTSLDKLVARPVDYEGIFSRASPAPALPGLLLPADEDHALLIALHAAGHDFMHGPACADLDLLLARGVDEGALLLRARQWRLETALFVMLSLLRKSGSTRVPDRWIHDLAPRGLRRAAVGLYVAHIEDPGAPLRLGWRWIARQTVLRDDLAAWGRGVVVYAGARAVELALPGVLAGGADCPGVRPGAQ